MVAVGILRLFIPVHISFSLFFILKIICFRICMFYLLFFFIFHHRDEIAVHGFCGAPVATQVPVLYHCIGV